MTLPPPPGNQSGHDPWYPADPTSGEPYPQYGQPQYGQPQPAQPQSGPPSAAQPQSAQPYSAQPYSGQPYSAQPYSAPPQYGMQPYSPQPAYPVPHPPQYTGGYAPYGIDPASGRPFSDKSKLVAGLLQLLPGIFLGLGGIGRLYAGHTALGSIQIGATLIGWGSFWIAVCGSFLLLPLLMFGVYGAVWLWIVVDGIVLLAGNPVDNQGRPLKT